MCCMSTRGFLIDRAHVNNLWFFIHFYYSQIITFTVSYYIFIFFLHGYDVTTLEIIPPIKFRKYAKHPIKVLRNENNMFF